MSMSTGDARLTQSQCAGVLPQGGHRASLRQLDPQVPRITGISRPMPRPAWDQSAPHPSYWVSFLGPGLESGPRIEIQQLLLTASPARQSVDVDVDRRCWTYTKDKVTKKNIYMKERRDGGEKESGDLGGFIYEGRRCQEAPVRGCKAGSNASRLVLAQ